MDLIRKYVVMGKINNSAVKKDLFVSLLQSTVNQFVDWLCWDNN
jgi:hypothetical protein